MSDFEVFHLVGEQKQDRPVRSCSYWHGELGCVKDQSHTGDLSGVSTHTSQIGRLNNCSYISQRIKKTDYRQIHECNEDSEKELTVSVENSNYQLLYRY
jgi:hypothetical protein